MSLSAAAILVVVLLTGSAVRGEDGGSVTYTAAHICALQGSTVEMHSTYSHGGTELPTTRWFHQETDHAPVDLDTDADYAGRVANRCDGNSCTLTVRDLRHSDSAEYKLRIETREGGGFTGSSGVTLSVTDLQVKVRRTAAEAELTCHSSCNVTDHPSYVWYNNGQKLEEDTASFRLTVNSSGRFSCAARGHEGHRSPPVYAPDVPSVSVSPSGDIVENSSVTLTCSSDANPAANYTWYKEGDSTALKQTAQLVFSPIYAFHLAKYYCTAENELGSNTSGYTFIDVKYAPEVPSLLVLPSGEITESSSVSLICYTAANPAANYTWYRKLFSSEPQLVAKTAQIAFRRIQSSDSGPYYCIAENMLGRKTSADVDIDVKYPPRSASVSVSPSGDIVENSSVTLTCSSDANPAANYTWYKEDQKLLQGDKGVYQFISIRPEDRGIYYCRSENRYQQVDSTSLFLDVYYAPDVPSVSVSPSGGIVENSSVTLTCSSDANPAANYTWYRTDSHPGSIHAGPQLVLSSILASDSQRFSCGAENQLGRTTSQLVFINVEYPPKTISVSVSPSGDIVENSSVTLTCSSDANPAANYTWYKEDEEQPKASGQNFTISDVRAEHSGKYWCEAWNSRGRRSSTVHLDVAAGVLMQVLVATASAVFLGVLLASVLRIIKRHLSKERFEPAQRYHVEEMPAEEAQSHLP